MPLMCMMMLDDPDDQALLTSFYDKYHLKMLRYTQHQFYKRGKQHLYSSEQIEDLVSDCFVKIAENIEHFNEMEEEERLKWSTAVLRNTIADFFKHEKYKEPYTAVFSQDHALHTEEEKLQSWEYAEMMMARGSKQDDVWNTILDKRLKALLSELPLKQRDLLEKRYILGYTNRQIAEMYQISESTIATRLQRSREYLKKILVKEGFEHV